MNGIAVSGNPWTRLTCVHRGRGPAPSPAFGDHYVADPEVVDPEESANREVGESGRGRAGVRVESSEGGHWHWLRDKAGQRYERFPFGQAGRYGSALDVDDVRHLVREWLPTKVQGGCHISTRRYDFFVFSGGASAFAYFPKSFLVDRYCLIMDK